MRATMHDATGACQLVGVAGPDATAIVGLTASVVSDANDDVEHDATNDDAKHDVTNDDVEHDAVVTMSLQCHLADYAATAVTVHVQPNGYGDPTHVLTATLCWCCILDRNICVVLNNKVDMPSHVTHYEE